MFRYLAENIAFLLIKHKILDIKRRNEYVCRIEKILLGFTILIIVLGMGVAGISLWI